MQKPARYIGCEDGDQAPVHAAHKVAWLLAYPDAYEIGLPNQGLHPLRDPERAPRCGGRAHLRPMGRMEALMWERRVLLFSVDTHRAGADFDLLAFNLSAELDYTNLLNCIKA